jgi:two-component system cell cycle sensor histidine kinase PleC
MRRFLFWGYSAGMAEGGSIIDMVRPIRRTIVSRHASSPVRVRHGRRNKTARSPVTDYVNKASNDNVHLSGSKGDDAVVAELTEKYAREKKRAEQALRTRSEFLANISHELRTPLNAVIGFAEMIRNSMAGDIDKNKYHEYIQDIYSSGQHLLYLINDILDIARMEEETFELNLQAMDISETVGSIAKTIRPIACEREIELEFFDELEDTLLLADKRAIKQVLLNLLSNSLKFTGRFGRVSIILYNNTDDRINLDVADNGVGIPATELSRLTHPFMQVDRCPFNKQHGGSGLGLAIARSLLEKHGGTLEIRSKLGKGTKVSCILPRKAVTIADQTVGSAHKFAVA